MKIIHHHHLYQACQTDYLPVHQHLPDAPRHDCGGPPLVPTVGPQYASTCICLVAMQTSTTYIYVSTTTITGISVSTTCICSSAVQTTATCISTTPVQNCELRCFAHLLWICIHPTVYAYPLPEYHAWVGGYQDLVYGLCPSVIALGAPWCRPSGLTRPLVDAVGPASVRDGL